MEKYVPEWCTPVDCSTDVDIANKYHVVTLPLFVATTDAGEEMSRMQTTSIPALTNWKNSLVEEAS
jgi:hypothetical protein